MTNSTVTVVDPLTYTLILTEQSLREEIETIQERLKTEDKPLMVKWLNVKLGRRQSELEGATAMLSLLDR